MSNIKELIRQEIERRAKFHDDAMKACVGLTNIALTHSAGWKEDTELLAFIDSLPEEDLYAEVGDTEEDYIKRSMAKVNECRKMICKDSLQVHETCEENTDSLTSLEEAANDSWALYEYRDTPQGLYSSCYRDGFIAGAKWQANQLLKGSPLPEDTVLFQKGVEEGKRLMMEEAVEGEIGYWNQRGLSIRLDKSLERLGYDMDTKVKIIIIKGND